MKIITTTFLVFFMYINIQDGLAIQCYNCKATRGSGDVCEMNPTRVTPTNCTTLSGPNHTHCITILTNSTVTRTCGNNTTCPSANTTNFVSCHICDKNACNNWVPSSAGFSSHLSKDLAFSALMGIALMSLKY